MTKTKTTESQPAATEEAVSYDERVELLESDVESLFDKVAELNASVTNLLSEIGKLSVQVNASPKDDEAVDNRKFQENADGTTRSGWHSEYITKEGDTLGKIAKRLLGNTGGHTRIQALNPGVPNAPKPGTKLRIPRPNTE